MSITIEADKAFFWSDLHLFHKAAMKDRGYKNMGEMHENIVACASHLRSTDTLFLLGDVSFGKWEPTRDILNLIPGRKVLVRGNHDSGLAKHLDQLFDEVHDLLRVKVVEYTGPEGHKKKNKLAEIICCHYPMLIWDKQHHGSWHLHGHCHGSLQHPGPVGKMLDVGADAWGDDGPLSFDEIKSVLDDRVVWSYDHHKPGMTEKGDWTL